MWLIRGHRHKNIAKYNMREKAVFLENKTEKLSGYEDLATRRASIRKVLYASDFELQSLTCGILKNSIKAYKQVAQNRNLDKSQSQTRVWPRFGSYNTLLRVQC